MDGFSSLRRLSACAAAALVCGCQLIASGEVEAGLGSPCERDDDCHASRCIDQVCGGRACTGDGCAPSPCEREGTCGELHVGVIYLGDPDAGRDEWSRAHEQGIREAEEQLSLKVTRSAGKILREDVAGAMDDLLAQGANVIVSTAPSMADMAAARAGVHPNVKFLTCGLLSQTSENHGAYYADMHHAAYVAGYAAAARSASKWLGVVGSYVTPAAVAYINAFALGARRQNPDSIVVVRWLGDWHAMPGTPTEAELTQSLMAMNCDVIAHLTDNGQPVLTALANERFTWAIGNNVEGACPDAEPDCLATTYWNWGPLYREMFSGLKAGSSVQGQLLAPFAPRDPGGVAAFRLAMNASGDQVAGEVGGILDEIARSPDWTPFVGPLYFTGSEAPLAPQERLSSERLRSLCAFVMGSQVSSPVIVRDPVQSRDVADEVPRQGGCATAR